MDDGTRRKTHGHWFALFVILTVVLAACGAQQPTITKVTEKETVEVTVVVTATPDEAATTTAEAAPTEVLPTAESMVEEGITQDALLIAIAADEQRDRWSARQPAEYEELEPPFSLDDQQMIDLGEEIYFSQDCAVCHGAEGNGQGIFSQGMNPRPIDLTDKALMDRLDDSYLFWRISEGGLEPPFLSAMPAFEEMLEEEQRWQLVAYLRSIATTTSELPTIGGVDFQVGLNVLQTYGCLACHRYNNQGNFVGPDLHDIGTKRSADELMADIIDPSAEIAEGFADTMPRDYSEQISEEDLNLMVDFLAASTGEVPEIAVLPTQEPEPTEEADAEEADAEEADAEEADAEEADAEEADATTVAETDEMTSTEEMTSTVAQRPPGPPLDGADDLPFNLDNLPTVMINGQAAFLPVNPFNIFINYELGMHCVGFNMTYCCMIPPYNSIQAQALRSSTAEEPNPKLLGPEDNVAMHYSVDDNSYSEGDKMVYWGVAKDANGDGDMDDANDNFANYVWTHLYIYEDLEGTIPEDATEEDRLHVGKEIPVQIDHGPSGMPMEGFAEYAGEEGGNIVFTESRFGAMQDIPLILTTSYVWDALGLPLTAFNDGVLEGGSHRTIDDVHFQPYQASRVTMYEVVDGEPVGPILAEGEPVSFIGTNPLDMPACSWCHGTERANTFGTNEYELYQDEYNYWIETYPDTSEYMARTKAGLISILEMHDDKHDTDFLAEYDVTATKNRLGAQGPVNCSDCHGDNVQGRLKSTDETEEEPIMSLPEAMHGVHLSVVADPDANGRTQSCQACHPAHTQNPDLNTAGTASTILDREGNPRYTDGDIRDSAGCYTGRDAHTNPDAEPPFFLNDIGQYLLENVSTVDGEIKGLYCTNCHNQNSQELYLRDNLETAQQPGEGETLRTMTLEEIVEEITGSDDVQAYVDYYMDPKVGAEGNPLVTYYTEHEAAPLGEGDLTYADASAGEDWWLSAAEPHCADCHVAPFVESMGGKYFPIDQENKYSLMRYSKAHANLACQSCHESIHGLYSVVEQGENTNDMTTHQQALQFSPDGEYTGPVTCVTCHAVGANGVPVQLEGTDYYEDYYSSVVLMHLMREEDYELSVEELLEKYPYEDSKAIVDDSLPEEE